MKQLLFFIFLVFILVSCKKEKTSWNSEWAMPLVRDTLSLENWYNDSTLESTNGTTLDLNLSRTLLNIGIDDLITIQDTIITQKVSPSFSINNIPPGTKFINQTEEHTFNLDGVLLKKVTISRGFIKLKVYNPLGTRLYYTIQLPNATKNGIPFEQTYIVEGGSNSSPGTNEETIDLSNFSLDLRGVNNLSFNKLTSILSVKSDPNGSVVSLSTSQVFKFDAQFIDLAPNYAKGYFGNSIISDTTTFNLNALNKITAGNIDLTNSSLNFEIENGAKVSLNAKLTMAQNTNNQGNTTNLTSSNIGNDIIISQAMGTSSNLSPCSKSISFNSSNSNIEQFLENAGATSKIGYCFQLNPWGNTSGGNDEIFSNSRIKVKFNAAMPLSIGADGLTLRDTFDINIQNNDVKTHIHSGAFILNTDNSFPISCQPLLYLMDENNFILYTIIGDSQISSSIQGTIDPKDGLMKKKSTVNFVVDESIAKNISAIKKVVIETIFNTPNASSGLSEIQSIPNGASLSVRLKLKLNAKIIT